MSQATLETATLEQSQTAEVSNRVAAIPTTDELLNKMAGEDVDRLLNETEADRSHVSKTAAEVADAPRTTQQTAAVADVDAVLAAQIDDLITGLDEPGAPAPAAKVEAPAANKVEVPVEPAVVSKVEAPVEAPAAKVETPAETSVAAPAADPAAEEARLKVLAAELEVDKPAAAKLAAPAAPAAPPAAVVAPQPAAAPILRPPASFLVRLLIRLNAPLAGCSDALRSAFGKVAVVNFLAAAALLVYAIMVRKPR
jgi:hypothetical protein